MAGKSNVTINGQDAKVLMSHYRALPCLIQALKDILNCGPNANPKDIAKKGLENWDTNRAKDIGDVVVRATVVNGNGG
jgi:hypothetical protein